MVDDEDAIDQARAWFTYFPRSWREDPPSYRAEPPSRELTADMVPAEEALDEATRVYRWFRRLSGDARKRNRIVDAIYKGI